MSDLTCAGKKRLDPVDIGLKLLVLVICLITVYPFYYVVCCSLSTPSDVVQMKVSVYPMGFYLDGYTNLLNDNEMWNAFLNSVIYVIGCTVLNCITSIMGAYPLTMKGLIGRRWVVRYLLVAMYFSGGIIPMYILISKLGIYDTRAAFIIPSAVSIWYIMIVRSFLAGIPDSLRESAQIDGANHFRILWSIYVPLAKPVLAVVAIYAIVGVWNSWFNSLLYQPSTNLHPLQMYLYRLLIVQSTDLSSLTVDQYESYIQRIYANTQLKYVIIVFTSLPILFTYPFFQRYFIKGVMIGSLKE